MVLLIDELNALRKPLDVHGALLLRRDFLDAYGRYVVFSSHVPMGLDDTIDTLLGTINTPPSSRGFIPLSMPFTTNVTVLRSMFGDQSSIVPTPVQVALYGGIPSLLYCALTGLGISPRTRFEMEIGNHPIPEEAKPQLLLNFVDEILCGRQKYADVRRFDLFSSLDEMGNISWPLCFMSPILGTLSHKLDAPARRISCLADDLSAYASKNQTGLDWEVMMQIAILLRCIICPRSGILPFFGGCEVLVVTCATIPAEFITSHDAYRFIAHLVNGLAPGTLLYLSPQCAKFPDYDGFLVFKAAAAAGTFRVVGIQVKLSRGSPKHLPVPGWIEAAVLLRGNAPERAHLSDKWTYWNRDQMVELLGVSLGSLYPRSWPEQPEVDDFF